MKTRFFRKAAATIVLGFLALALGVASLSSPAIAQGPGLPAGASVATYSPADGEVAYAAAGRTLLRSDDGGVSWTEVATLASVITAISPAYQNPSLVYIGTESGGVYRSFDQGDTWQPINDGLGMLPGAILEVSALAVDPKRDQVLVAATGYWLGTTAMHFSPVAIMSSVDGGSTWLRLSSLPINSGRIVSLIPDDGRPLAGLAQMQTGASLEYGASVSELSATLLDANGSSAQRAAAAQTLGLVKDTAAVPSLIAALATRDAHVVTSASQALGAMKSAEAVPALRQVLTSRDSVAPSAAAEALAAIGDPAAMDVLLQVLGDEDVLSAQHAAKRAIEQAGSSAIPGLVTVLVEGSPAGQRNAAEMLGWIADPSAVGSLVDALNSSDAAVRGQVAWALGEIGNPTAQQALRSLAVTDPSPEVRLQATQALVHLPQPPVVTFESAPPAAESGAALPESVTASQERGLRAPQWLQTIMPVLRWIIVMVVLAIVAVLPWYQMVRENRRRRHN